MVKIQQTISRLASQCVMCGLCLPHCPTYMLFRDENESPRGRISLLKAMAENQLQTTPTLIRHIDHCLSCKACEAMCPSEVRYADIVNLGRELIAAEKKTGSDIVVHQSRIEKLLLNKSSHAWLKAASALAAGGGKVTARLLGRLNIQSAISRLSNIAAEVSQGKALQPLYPVTEPVARVALFSGCTGELFEHQTLLDTIELLNACQIEVTVPQRQCCCGGISQRHGNRQEQIHLQQQNIEAFTDHDLEADDSAIISVTNSCSAQLKDYAQDARLDPEAAKQFALRVSDSLAYLHGILKSTATAQSASAAVSFAPLAATILVHIPCSLKNILHGQQQLLELLQHIPQMQLKLISAKYCCGAAGSYMLKYPHIADQLLELKIDDIIASGSRLIVSSNVGCTLHLKQRLQQLDYAVEIIHPVSLLLKQMKIFEQKDQTT